VSEKCLKNIHLSLISSHTTSSWLTTDLISSEPSVLLSNPVCHGCDWSLLCCDWSQPRRTGSLHSALIATQFRRNEVTRDKTKWDEISDVIIPQHSTWYWGHVRHDATLDAWQFWPKIHLHATCVQESPAYNPNTILNPNNPTNRTLLILTLFEHLAKNFHRLSFLVLSSSASHVVFNRYIYLIHISTTAVRLCDHWTTQLLLSPSFYHSRYKTLITRKPKQL